MSPTLSSATGTDTPARPPTAALDASAVDIGAVDAADVDLTDSHDPHLLIPGDPVTLLAAARALVHNADLHDTLAIRQRRLHDGGWSGAAADAFHSYLTRQATRHAGAADATRTAARALTELADGIDQARTQARRAALLHTDGDPDQRTGRSDPGLREQAHALLADTRAALEDLRTRVRAQLALAQDALPDSDRLLTDPAAAAHTGVGAAGAGAAGLYPSTPTPIQPAGAGPSATADATTIRSTDAVALHHGSSGGATVGVLAIEQRPRRQIVVRAGDTLSGIATRELGDPTRWPDILDANPTLTHPWQIQPGQHLILPDTPAPPNSQQPVPDQPGSGHPAPTPPPTALPHTTASPSPIIDTIDHPGSDDAASSDAGGIGLEEGLFIGGGLAAALSLAFLLRQRRRDGRFRPDMPSSRDPADPIRHLDDLDGFGDLDVVDDVRGRSGRDRAARRRGGSGLPDLGRGEQDPDTNTFAAASLEPATELFTPDTRSPAVDRRGPGLRPETAAEPPMPPVVRRLHYAYHRTPHTGRAPQHTPGAVTGWAGPPLAPQPRRSAAPRDTGEHVRAPLVVPLGLNTTTSVGVYADLTLAPALALTNLPEPETLEQHRDRAEDVARALLLTIAAGLRTPLGDPLGHVVITSADLHRLLDLTEPLPRAVTLPSTIRVVEDLGAALDDLEVTLTHRPPHPGLHSPPPPAVVLIATAPRPGTPTARMQRLLARLLTAGHPHRVCAVLLGDWPTPARITVAANATAAAVTGPLPLQLAGARLFTVPRHDALELLAALARPTDPDHTPTPTDNATDDPALRDSVLRDSAAHPTGPHSDDTDSDTPHHLPNHDDHRTAPEHRPSEATAAVTPTPTEPGLRLQVFGRVSLRSQPDRIDALNAVAGTDDSPATPRGLFSDRDLELLVYLALHPGGVSHERLAADLWPDTTRPTAADLNAAITALDAALTPGTGELTHPAIHAIRTDRHGHHRLNPRLVTTDYHDFTAALADRSDATTAEHRATADRALLHQYRGALAPDLHTDWINALRAHAARAAVTAALDLARYLHDDPDQAVAVLQHAIAVIDPCNEALYAALIRLHRDHDRPEAALRTFAALVTQLATIEATPSPDITALIGLS